MWIQELNLKNFGKFTNKQVLLEPRINLIYGENESGKSTIHGFIRGCLYGLRKMRGRASKNDLYTRFRPIENPNYYAGWIRFVCGSSDRSSKIFRLERDFIKGPQDGVLICETDGEHLSLENGDLEMLLGGIGEVAFENTVSIGQLKNETDEGLAVALKNYLANLEGAGNQSIHVERALLLLKEEKKNLEKHGQNQKRKKEEQWDRICTQIQFGEEEVKRDKRELEMVRCQLGQVETAQRENRKMECRKNLFFRLICWIKNGFRWMFRKQESLGKNADVETKRKDSKQIKELGKVEYLESRIREKELMIENHKQEIELQKNMYRHKEEREEQQEIEAYLLAMSRIKDVISHMQMDTGLFLKERTSEIFCELTDHKYYKVEFRQDQPAGVHEKERYIPLELLSKGTIWQLYFSYRMAVNDVLGKEETLPIILDDALAMYDAQRLTKTLRWLARQERQVIVFSCQTREMEIMKREEIPFHLVRL